MFNKLGRDSIPNDQNWAKFRSQRFMSSKVMRRELRKSLI